MGGAEGVLAMGQADNSVGPTMDGGGIDLTGEDDLNDEELKIVEKHQGVKTKASSNRGPVVKLIEGKVDSEDRECALLDDSGEETDVESHG